VFPSLYRPGSHAAVTRRQPNYTTHGGSGGFKKLESSFWGSAGAAGRVV